jgi:hypothetical protein
VAYVLTLLPKVAVTTALDLLSRWGGWHVWPWCCETQPATTLRVLGANIQHTEWWLCCDMTAGCDGIGTVCALCIW